VVFEKYNDIQQLYGIIYTCGLAVAVYGAGLRTSEHLSWKGALKVLKLVMGNPVQRSD